jgi:hypothetical protein
MFGRPGQALLLGLILLAHLGLGWGVLWMQAHDILSAASQNEPSGSIVATVILPQPNVPLPVPPTAVLKPPVAEKPAAQSPPKKASPPKADTAKPVVPPPSEAPQVIAAPPPAQTPGSSAGDEKGSDTTSYVGTGQTGGSAGAGQGKVEPETASGVNTGGTSETGSRTVENGQKSGKNVPKGDSPGQPTKAVEPAAKVPEPGVPTESESAATGNPANVALYKLPLAAFPAPVRLTYAVHAPKDFEESGATGTAELRTEHGRNEAGLDTFSVNIDIKLGWLLNKMVGGALRYQSQGLLGRNGPQTQRYSEKVGDRAERWLEVDRDKKTMKSYQAPSLAVEAGAQDRLSVMWLLGMLARTDASLLEKGRVFTVPMFSFRQIYPGRFESFGPSVLLSPAGVLQSLHVGYRTQEVGGDQVDIWLGYDYDMQPVRIRWKEAEGRVIDLVLLKK